MIILIRVLIGYTIQPIQFLILLIDFEFYFLYLCFNIIFSKYQVDNYWIYSLYVYINNLRQFDSERKNYAFLLKNKN